MKKRDLQIWSERRDNKRLYASGGRVRSAKPYIVGETRPEPFPLGGATQRIKRDLPEISVVMKPLPDEFWGAVADVAAKHADIAAKQSEKRL